MIGIEDHLGGNGDRQEIIEVHPGDLEVEEVEVVVEVIEMVVEMEEEVVVEGEELLLEVLRPRELFLWKRGKLNIHYGIFDRCNSRVLVPWPLK
jgi:hypothetical protein